MDSQPIVEDQRLKNLESVNQPAAPQRITTNQAASQKITTGQAAKIQSDSAAPVQEIKRNKILKRNDDDKPKEQTRVVQRKSTQRSDKNQKENVQQVKEKQADSGFSNPKFDQLCRAEGSYEKYFNLRDENINQKNGLKFDIVNKINKNKGGNGSEPVEAEKTNDEEEGQNLNKDDEITSESSFGDYYCEDYEQQEIVDMVGEYNLFLKINEITFLKTETKLSDDKISKTIYLKCHSNINFLESSSYQEQPKDHKYILNGLIKAKTNKNSSNEFQAQLDVYDANKKLIGVAQCSFDQSNKQFEIKQAQIVDQKIQINEGIVLGNVDLQGQVSKIKYNERNQIRIHNLRLQVQEDSNLNLEQNASKVYFLQIGFQYQQKAYLINIDNSEIQLLEYYLLFYPKEQTAQVLLIEQDLETITQNIVGKGELSLRINGEDIPIEINNSEKHMMTILVNVETPYNQYEQEILNKKNGSILNKSIDSKINNSKLMSDSIYQSPQNSNLKLFTQENKMQKSISFRGMASPVNDFAIQNDSKITSNLGQNPRAIKLKPINNIQTPTDRSIRNDFQVDQISLRKKASLISLNSPKIDFNKPRDLNQIMKSYNINNGMIKNQSSILLKKPYNTPSPLNDLGLNKAQSKVSSIRSSLDNYNIISGQPGSNKSQLANDNFSMVSSAIMKKSRVSNKSEVQKKKFNFIKKNVNQFKDQEKFDPDKDYDNTKEVFEKGNTKESQQIEKSDIQKPNEFNASSKFSSMILAEPPKDILQESIVQDSKPSSKFFIDLPQEQQQKVLEERNKVIQDQMKLNQTYIVQKTDFI